MDNKSPEAPPDQISQMAVTLPLEAIQKPHPRQIECIILDYIKYPEERKAQHIEWLLSRGYHID